MAKPKPLPPVELLRELFSYDPETGAVTRLKATSNRLKVGDTVGTPSICGYLRFHLNGTTYPLHRLIWKLQTGKDAPKEIDHVNRDKQDNRWSNLRAAEHSENQANKPYKPGRYLRGARRTPYGAWYATCHGKHLGMASSEEHAHEMYKEHHVMENGEFSPYWPAPAPRLKFGSRQTSPSTLGG